MSFGRSENICSGINSSTNLTVFFFQIKIFLLQTSFQGLIKTIYTTAHNRSKSAREAGFVTLIKKHKPSHFLIYHSILKPAFN